VGRCGRPGEVTVATRRWALPILIDLYRTPEVSKAEGVRHRTPAQLMGRLLRLLLIRFPDRTFGFAGDSGLGPHEVARFCHRHRRRLTMVSKCHLDVNLFAPPPRYVGTGRPRVKGERLPKPRAAALSGRRRRLYVTWYGGGTQRVETGTGTGHWDMAGAGLVSIFGDIGVLDNLVRRHLTLGYVELLTVSRSVDVLMSGPRHGFRTGAVSGS
jgi:hypothetical protein